MIIGQPCDAVESLGALGGHRPHPARFGRVLHQAQQSIGDGRRVGDRQDPRLFSHHDIAHRADVRGHHGESRKSRLDQTQWRPLVVTGEHNHIGRGKNVLDVIPPAQVSDGQRRGGIADDLSVITFACHEKVRIGCLGTDALDDLDESVRALDPGQPPDEGDDWSMRVESELSTCLISRKGRWEFQARRNDGELCWFPDAGLEQVITDLPSDGHQSIRATSEGALRKDDGARLGG